MKIFSPAELKAGKSFLKEITDDLEAAITKTFLAVLNQELSLQWAEQNENGAEELPSHFVYKFDREAVTQHVIDRVLSACRHAGWIHSIALVDAIIIAREPYRLGSGRGERQTNLVFPT